MQQPRELQNSQSDHIITCSALRGNSWPVQARLRLTRVQKDQLTEQGTENATVLAMQQGQSAGIASMLQVCECLKDAFQVPAWAVHAQDEPDLYACSVLRSSTAAAHSAGSCVGCSACWEGGWLCHAAAPNVFSLSPQPPKHMTGRCTLRALKVECG